MRTEEQIKIDLAETFDEACATGDLVIDGCMTVAELSNHLSNYDNLSNKLWSLQLELEKVREISENNRKITENY